VRDSACQSPNCLHFLGVADLLLEVFSIGDVRDHRERAFIAASRVQNRRGGKESPQVGSVLADEAQIVLALVAFTPLLEALSGLDATLLIEEIEKRSSHHFFRDAAEHLGHSAVHEGGEVLGVDGPNSLAGGLDDPPILQFTVPQRRLGALLCVLQLCPRLCQLIAAIFQFGLGIQARRAFHFQAMAQLLLIRPGATGEDLMRERRSHLSGQLDRSPRSRCVGAEHASVLARNDGNASKQLRANPAAL